jgi:exopolysaccharide biosynthesis polyprenyl glycosylphosphotransferase
MSVENPADITARWAPRTGQQRGSAWLLPAARSRRAEWEARYIHRLLVIDLLVGLLATVVAFYGRFGGDVTGYNRNYLLVSVLLPVAWVATLAFYRAYEDRYLFVGVDEYQRVIRAGVTLTAAIAVVSYGFKLQVARGYVVIALPLATVACVAARFAARKLLHRSRISGACMRRVLVVGHERAASALTRQLRRERYHGLEVVGFCLPDGASKHTAAPVYGTFADVGEAVGRVAADTVVVLSCPEFDGQALRRLAWHLERDDVDLIVASALIDVAGYRTTLRPVDGLPLLHVEHPRLTGARRAVKEVADLAGAALALVLFAPLMLGIAVAVRLTSPGPALFRQERVGRGGSTFVIYKFRTMYLGAEACLLDLRASNEYDGLLFKIRDDPRVTPLGRWLRRWSLDELPQLFNVMRRQMSLVGPRPPLPSEVAQYPDDMRRRFVVKPGITGLWQVSGRADLSWEETIRLDLRYVEHWSLSLDLVIMLRTLTAVIRSSGAY